MLFTLPITTSLDRVTVRDTDGARGTGAEADARGTGAEADARGAGAEAGTDGARGAGTVRGAGAVRDTDGAREAGVNNSPHTLFCIAAKVVFMASCATLHRAPSHLTLLRHVKISLLQLVLRFNPQQWSWALQHASRESLGITPQRQFGPSAPANR